MGFRLTSWPFPSIHPTEYNHDVTEILLRTKLFVPPLRPSLVPRSRLLTKLEDGIEGKLSLVAAPAGFGKTTLIVHWLKQQARPVAWLSLDENDDLPLRFFTYLATAIQTINPHLAQNLAASLRSAAPPDETAVIPALLNELAAHPEPFILVLDDYHTLTHTAIHSAMAFLIDYLPPSIHLVITSRAEPPLPLPRWRVRHQLTDIRAADLRFTTDEAMLFLQETMGLTLSETAVSQLESRTEGWVAGLQLAALSLRNSEDVDRFIEQFMGSERQVADYLLQEVLQQQPEPIQRFLLQTAVLERFNAKLCDYLLERQNSQAILATLEQSNLFIIPLDNARTWYRYHHLFAQLLRYRLQRDGSETAVANLHRRAAHWYENQNLLEEAIAHAFQIPDYEEVARLIATIPLHYMYEDGGGIQIQEWVKRLPKTLMPVYPYVAALMAGAAMLNGKLQTTYEYLDLIEEDDTTQGYKNLYRSIMTRNESGDHQQALLLARQALAAAGEDKTLATLARGQIAVNYYNLGQLEETDQAIMEMRQSIRGDDNAALNMQLQAIELQTINAFAQGNLHRAERLCREGIDLATQGQQSRSPLIGIMYTNLGNVYYQWNEIAQTKHYVEKALDWAHRTGISDLFTYSAFIQCNLACLRGDKEALRAALKSFTAHFNVIRMERMYATVERLAAWYWLRIGELETAVRWANASGLTLDDDPAYHEFDAYQTLVAIRLAESRQSGNRRLLPQMLSMAEKLERLVVASRHVVGLIEALTLKALILDSQNDLTAVATVKKALNLAQPGNMLREFLDWGRPMRQLLAKTVSTHPAFVGRLLREFDEEMGETAVSSTPTANSPAIQLTARENEVLQLIASGLANKQIEETLFISKNTVRTHIKNLYSKLGVKSRTQAIKQAQNLDLL
ncbi:MAG: hypothetical protein GY803_29545 [Chloroflexi bacterium]|nr:hypothetical protein [Chloroflexota bacterium]